jgi:hypothetical protein
LEILYPKISVHVRGTGIKGTRYKYRYRYEVQVRIRGTCIGTSTRYVRGTGMRYRYRYEVQVRGTSIKVQLSFVLPRVPSVSTLGTLNSGTLGTRGNTKEGAGAGTRYRYRCTYGPEFGFTNLFVFGKNS